MKNVIYAVVIALCLVLAAVVFLWTGGGDSGGISSIDADETQWVICLKCDASYEMNKREFYTQQQENMVMGPTPVTMPLACNECGEQGIVKAVKCPECGNVFQEGSVRNALSDTCPKCKYSQMQADRDAARAARQSGN
jgi:phage FluMu protein Com